MDLILFNLWLLNSFSVHFSQSIDKSYFPLNYIFNRLMESLSQFNNRKGPLKRGITNLVTNRTCILLIYLHWSCILGNILTLKTVKNNLPGWFESIANSKSFRKKLEHIFYNSIITVCTYDLSTFYDIHIQSLFHIIICSNIRAP